MADSTNDFTPTEQKILFAALRNTVGPIVVDGNGIVADTKLAVKTVRNTFSQINMRHSLELSLTMKPCANGSTPRKRKESPSSTDSTGQRLVDSAKPAKARKIAVAKGGGHSLTMTKGKSPRAQGMHQEVKEKETEAWLDQVD